MNIRSIKTQVILFLSVFGLFLVAKEQRGIFLSALVITTLAAVITEVCWAGIIKKKFLISDSAMITGLIVGFVVRSEEPWWILALVSFFAISSKYVIRFNDKHIFNPAAFGILVGIFLFKIDTQWAGTYYWYVLVPAGIYISYRIRKLPLHISYGIAALGLFALQAIQHSVPIATIFGYLSYFFIFIMLIEPKTTPVTLGGKVVFGTLMGGVIFLLTEWGISIDAELSALLLCNVAVPMLNLIKRKKRNAQ